MFTKWFSCFSDNDSNTTRLETSIVSGDNGAPVGKDLAYLTNAVVTNDNKIRIVLSA